MFEAFRMASSTTAPIMLMIQAPTEPTATIPSAPTSQNALHWDPAPRVPRPRRGLERNATASPGWRLPHLLPPLPDSPLLGEGHTGAETGGAPRSGWNRRDAHGRRPASSVHAAGCVRSCRPASVPAALKLAVSGFASRCSLFLAVGVKSARTTLVLAGCPSLQRSTASDDGPPPVLRVPGWAKWKGQPER